MIGIQSVIDQVLTYVKGIWIKKRYIIISSWLICPIGWGYVASIPDQYQSSAKVFVDTNSLLRPLLRGLAVYNDPNKQVDLVARTLFSQPTMEKIAREADLDITAKTQDDLNRVVDGLKNRIKLSSTRDQNIYTISYQSRNPVLAQKIVQITLNEFVESSLGSARRGNDSAEEFLSRQIKEYEQRLIEGEQRLAEYKKNKMDRLPGDSGSYYGKLQRQKNELEQAELRLNELRSQLASVDAQLAGEVPVFGLATPEENGDVNPGVSTKFDRRIAAMEARLDELLIQYTDQHPDVIKINKLIDDLKEERNKQIDKMSQVAVETGSFSHFGNLNQNPVYQELKLAKSRVESETASILVRVENYKAEVAKLEEQINIIPVIEAEFNSLNRDYGIIKSKYLELLKRKDSAELSRKAEASADDIQFRIIDPPRLPKKPTGSKRMIFYTVILIIGFGVGLVVAFLLSQLNPVVFSHRQLTEYFNIPILGAVSHLESNKMLAINKRRVVIFSLSSAVLFALYIGIMSMESIYGKLPLSIVEGLI